jgi:hypothetical protein
MAQARIGAFSAIQGMIAIHQCLIAQCAMQMAHI